MLTFKASSHFKWDIRAESTCFIIGGVQILQVAVEQYEKKKILVWGQHHLKKIIIIQKWH